MPREPNKRTNARISAGGTRLEAPSTRVDRIPEYPSHVHARTQGEIPAQLEGSRDILKGKEFWKRSALMIRRETDFTSDQELIRYDYRISSDSPSITRV